MDVNDLVSLIVNHLPHPYPLPPQHTIPYYPILSQEKKYSHFYFHPTSHGRSRAILVLRSYKQEKINKNINSSIM